MNVGKAVGMDALGNVCTVVHGPLEMNVGKMQAQSGASQEGTRSRNSYSNLADLISDRRRSAVFINRRWRVEQ